MFKDFLRMASSTLSIFKDNLMLWLDGKDFINSPPTTLWRGKTTATSVTYTNLVSNSNYSNGTTGWIATGVTMNVSGGELSFLATLNKGRVGQILTYNVGDKIYRSVNIKATSNLVGLGRATATYVYHTGSGNYERLSNITVADATMYTSIIDNRTSAWTTVYVKDVLTVNLTALFGTGLEPTQSEADLLFAYTATSNTIERLYSATPTAMSYVSTSGSDGLGGVVLDGTKDYLTIINTISLNKDFTFMTSFRPATDTGTQVIFCKNDHANIEFRIVNGYLSLYVGGIDTVGTYKLSPNTKYIICVKRSGTTYSVYVDNVWQYDKVSAYAINDSYNLVVGCRNSTKISWLKATIYSLLFYNRALSISELTQTYNAIK